MNMSIEKARGILNTETTDLKELRKIYIEKAQRWHPDVIGNSDAKEWNKIIEAYYILKAYLEAQPCPYCGDTGVEIVQRGFNSFEVPCKHCSV